MMAVLRLRLPRSADFGVLTAAVGRRGGGTFCQLEPLVRADFLSHCVPSIYNSCSIQKGLLNLPKVECLTLVWVVSLFLPAWSADRLRRILGGARPDRL
jgi:hypothetical protein